MKKKLFLFFRFLGAILCTASILLSGMGIGNLAAAGAQQAAESMDTIRNIAVVNLDEGTESEDGRINYAAQLMAYPGDNFLPVSLSEARIGVQEGSFAAYVIIPNDFSRSAQSINRKPQAISLEYAVNPRLAEEIRPEIIRDINAFETMLNSNLSYMYVSAILKEFYQVQDGSATLLDNDRKDMENIENVGTDAIMQEPEYEIPEPLENIIEDIDLSEIYDENNQLVEDVDQYYRDFFEDAEQGFQEVKEEITLMTEPMEVMMQEFESFDPAYDADGNLVYQEGLDALKALFDQHNQQLLDDREYLMALLGLGSYLADTRNPEDVGGTIPSQLLPEDILPNQMQTEAEAELARIIAAIDSDEITVDALRELLIILEQLQEEISEEIDEENDEGKTKRQATAKDVNKADTAEAKVEEADEGTETAADPEAAAGTETDDSTAASGLGAEDGAAETGAGADSTATTGAGADSAAPSGTGADSAAPSEAETASQPLSVTRPAASAIPSADTRMAAVLRTSAAVNQKTTTVTTGNQQLAATALAVGDPADPADPADPIDPNEPDDSVTAQLELLNDCIVIIDQIIAVNTDQDISAIDMLVPMKAYFEDMINEINKDLFREIITSEFETILENQIIAVIDAHVAAQAAEIDLAVAATIEGTNAFLLTMEEYDPYLLYDPEPVDESMSQLGENIFEIQYDMNDKHFEYQQFVDEVYFRSDEIDIQLEESLQNAYTASEENLSGVLEGFKQSRSEVHQENADLLDSFTQKLSYTRLGQVEDTEVYDFIVKPIEMEQTTVESLSIISRSSQLFTDPLLLAMIAVIVLSAAFLMFRIVFGKSRAEEGLGGEYSLITDNI